MLEWMLYSTNYKTTCFAGSGHHQVLSIKNTFKIVLYNLRNGIFDKISSSIYSCVFEYLPTYQFVRTTGMTHFTANTRSQTVHIYRPSCSFISKYYDVSIMCAQYQGGWEEGEAGKNYWGPAVRKGARGPTRLHT